MAECERCNGDFYDLDDNDLCEECHQRAGIDRAESYNDLD